MAEVATASQLVFDVHVDPAERRTELEADLRLGLSRPDKRVSALWFYDERGSSLFDAITGCEEYYLAVAEEALLARHAEQVAAAAPLVSLIELGSGTSRKARLLLDALAAAGHLELYVPVDTSAATLQRAAEQIAVEYPEVGVHAFVGDFRRHLAHLPTPGARLVAFLGNTIGNLRPGARHQLLSAFRRALAPSDLLLLGVDLVKDEDRLVAAYDDAGGLTAAFNRNALSVMNREFGGDFDPDRFDHLALWNRRSSWVELRLRSQEQQWVHFAALDLTVEFERGETLLTEISAKFTVGGFASELEAASFALVEAWTGCGDVALLLARPC